MTRGIVLTVFVVLTLPVIPWLAVTVEPLNRLLEVDLLVRAVPLFLTWVVDNAFLDGGEVTPQLIPLWVLLTGLMLWPLLVLGLRPEVWASDAWRKRMIAYGALMLAATMAAGWWVFTHLGIFF